MKAVRRTRSPHPGVVLLRPDPEGRHPHWRARYEDPDTRRSVKVTLDPLAVTTAEARRDWAIRKAKALAKRRLELEGGAPRATGTALADAVAGYFKAHPQLREKTLAVYEAVGKKFVAWAAKSGVRSADDLNRARLLGFREQLANQPKHVAAPQAKRGVRRATAKRRSAHSVNRELRATRTILGYLCDLDTFSRLSHDDLRRALKRLETPVERIDYLKPHELQKLIEAALRHDAETFAATREEHAGLRPLGSTVRYTAIAPFVAAALLTGMRAGELMDLEWRGVDLEALDNEGRAVGEIHLSGATKTKRARTVGLEVSPALRKMLAALQLNAGGGKANNATGSVFGLTHGTAKAATKRLLSEYGAPKNFTWQALRRTCGTFLTNAPGIFGAASAYRSAKQLGHSVQVAERHYVDVARGIPRDARTLEDAMQIAAQIKDVIAAVGSRPVAAGAATRKIG